MNYNSFVNAVSHEADAMSKMKFTENGAVALNTTDSALLDLYGVIGAMRPRSESDIINMFRAAWKENNLLALKMAFYSRNVRGGQGERRTPRIIFKWLANAYPEVMKKNFDNIAKFGRYDDFYVFVGTTLEKDMWAYLKATIYHDMSEMVNGKPTSLCAKWLKSVNSSSAETRMLGKMTAKAFGLSEEKYRKMLSSMRKYIDVVEVKMSKNNWKNITYSAVPAKAMTKYRAAFKRHCPELFETYISRVESGKETIKAATLYPYDLVHQYGYSAYNMRAADRVIEAQWKALPNYVEGENNILVMADISGSMCGRPMETSIGLAIYFAERNHGAFKNLYMAFSSTPTYLSVDPNKTLRDNIATVSKAGLGFSTNLEGAFNKVLNTAVTNHVPKRDMPKAIVVISDMEIDRYTRYGLDFVTSMKHKFNAHGYDLPKLIMWNVEARENTYHGRAENPYVQFVSGQSPSAFKSVIEAINCDAYNAMLKTLNNKMYDSVVL